MPIAPTGGTVVNGGSQVTSSTITVPSGILGGDVVWVLATVVPISATVATITASSTGTTPTAVTGGNKTGSESLPATVTGQLFSFTAAGTPGNASSDVGKVITLTYSTSGFPATALQGYSGANTTTPADVINGAFGGANTLSVTCPILSTGVNGDWAVFFGCGAAEGAGLTTLGIPAGSTARQNLVGSVNIGAAITDSNAAVGAAGASIGGGTFTATSATNSILVGFTVGMAPAGSPAPPSGAPLPVPNPRVLNLLLDEWYQRADWQAQGVADLTVAFASTSGGVDTYNVTSPWNNYASAGTQQMRVLKPTAPNANYPHAFLVMLPVDPNQVTSFGDSIGTALSLGAHNTYNLTCVQPGYASAGASATGPWFGDNPLDPTISQEKYTLLVVDWIRQHLATTGTEKVYLIGFSRSGLAAQFLQFRHPYLFPAVASWDTPFGMTDYDGTDPNGTVGGNPADVFGTSASFQTNYELTAAHLGFWQATGQYGVNRIWIGQGPVFTDITGYDAALTAAGIPHVYNFHNTVEGHAWQTDWVSAALTSIIPSNAPTVLPQQVHQQLLTELLKVAEYRRDTAPAVASPPAPPASIAFVQAASNTAGASSTVTVTLASPTTRGNCLVACVANGAGSNLIAPTSITLGGSADNWAVLKAAGTGSSSAECVSISADPNCAGGQTSVQINCAGGGSAMLAWVFEFSGLVTSSVLDQFGTFDSAGGTNPTFSLSTGGGTSQASELAIGCAYGFNNTITGPASPWVNESTLTAASSRTLQAGYQILSSAGTVTYSGSFGGATFNGQVLVTLRGAGAASAPPAAPPPPLIRPHPYGLIRDEAQQRADWAAAGIADLTVKFASTSGGVDTYNVTSPYNGTATYQMRVLAPTAPNPDFPHAFLIMLPVQQNQDTNLYGDSIGTAQSIAAHNGWNLTCVQPGYAPLPSNSEGPWFADNPLTQAISQEKFTLLITAWIRQHLATTGIEQVYLAGFSRSGLGAVNLLFRYPYTYAAVAVWDAPMGMTDYDGTDPIRGSTVGGDPQDGFGTSANFTNHYQMTTARLAGYQGTGQYGINRISLGLGPDFGADVPWFDGQLTANGIPHTYTFANTVEAHAWQSDWVAAGLQAIIPSQAPTVLPQQLPPHVLDDLLEVASYRLAIGSGGAGATAVSGGTVLGGAGSLGTAAALGAAAVLGGQGLVSASANVAQPGAAALTAAGSLTAAAAGSVSGAGSLAGAGSLGTAAVLGATAVLTGTGSLTAGAAQGVTAALAGTGSLTAGATQGVAATMTAAGSLTASAGGAVSGAAALAGAGSLAGSGGPAGIATITGAGALTAGAGLRAVTTVTGAGALGTPGVVSAGAVLIAAGSLATPVLGTRGGSSTATSVTEPFMSVPGSVI